MYIQLVVLEAFIIFKTIVTETQLYLYGKPVLTGVDLIVTYRMSSIIILSMQYNTV